MEMIEVSNLGKSYGSVRALRNVEFEIEQGEIVGLLGPNGAGKTTIIKILTGYLQPDEGEARVNGLDVMENRLETQAQIGYLPENAPLYKELSTQEYLKMIADLRMIPPEERLRRISEAARSTQIEDQLTRPIGHLSKGYRQRVGLAQAILSRPKLLIFDEPTVGLDPTQIVEIRNLIRRLADRSTVLFSTHILSEVEALCDRVIILMNGEVRADARLSELAASPDAVLTLQSPVKNIQRQLKQLDGVESVKTFESTDGYPSYRIQASPDTDLCPALYRLSKERGWHVREIKRDARTLESVFNDLATSG